MYEQVENRLSSSVELLSVSQRGDYCEEALEILVEYVRDRITGYPSMEGWEEGRYAPFESNVDVEGPGGERIKKRMYPLNQPPVPLDFHVVRDMHDMSDSDRYSSTDGNGNGNGNHRGDPFIDPRLKEHPNVISSTKSASYTIPVGVWKGNAPPSINETADLLKDDALYQTTGDLSVLLKAMYETVDDVLMLEITFFNGGEGSSLRYPAVAAGNSDDSGSNSNSTYVTQGCEWTTEVRNPYTGKPYAAKSPCHPPGTVVPTRYRNLIDNADVKKVMEYTSLHFEGTDDDNDNDDENDDDDSGGTNGTRTASTSSRVPPNNSQKLKRDKAADNLISWNGPLVVTDNETVVLTLSKAIFDRVTNEFIGVATMLILSSKVGEDLQRRTLDDDSDAYIIYNDPNNNNNNNNTLTGLIVGSTPGAEHKVFERLPEIDEIKADLQRTYYDQIPNWEEWRDNQGTVRKPERIPTTYFARTKNGGFLASVPIPPTPEYPWDDARYGPIGFLVQKIEPSVFEDFFDFEKQVKQDVKKSIILCVLLGVFGLVLILLILAAMSKILTQPLTWIAFVARKIISNDSRTWKSLNQNNKSSHGTDTLIEVKNRKKSMKKKEIVSGSTNNKICTEDSECTIIHSNNEHPPSTILKNDRFGLDRDLEANDLDEDDEVGFVNFDYNSEGNQSLCCTLSTELQLLLEAFQSMIHGFSGDGVSEVAEPALCEIQNCVIWHSDFAKLYEYNREKSGKNIRQVSNATNGTTDTSIENSGAFIIDTSYHSIGNNEITTPDIYHKSNQPDSRHDSMVSSGSSSSLQIDEKTLQEHSTFSSRILRHIESQQSMPKAEHECEKSTSVYLPGQLLGPTLGAPQTIVPAPLKVNLTSTLGAPKFDPRPTVQQKDRIFGKIKTACKSKLFWWIVLLMALPVFLTNCVIASIMSKSILITLPTTWAESAKRGSNAIEMDAMELIVDRKAAIMANMMEGPARDIYVLARTTSWLIFGGIQRSDKAAVLDSTSERCKTYPEGECPYSKPCSCGWGHGWNLTGVQCDGAESDIDSRYLQRQWFEVQKLDSNPITGERISSPSFPISPESTLWWKNATELPGSEIGPSRTSGYDTLYNRVAVSSASAVFNLPIHNYQSFRRKERTTFGGYLAFAVDGLLLGWSGCDDWHSSAATFVSTYENGASLNDGKLCANGKHGYDPRCQDWYVQGRDRYLRDDVPAHVTPPHKVALSNQIAQTITSPITNPRTGEYVGQVALNFRLNYGYVLKMLDGESSLTFMITPHKDILGGNAVFCSFAEELVSESIIEDHIFSNEANEINRDYFKEEILPRMKAGERGNSRFFITREDGSEEEICFYYAPVKIALLLGLEPDDFTSSQKVTEHLIYSVGSGKPCDEIKRPYEGVEDKIIEELTHPKHIFFAIIVSSTAAFIIFSAVAAIYISFPMIKLSTIVKNTKKGEYDSIPPLEGGCKEVQCVYNTFAKLNKIVKISNTSFFSGKLDIAHHFVNDALVLYRKINDRKAIGVTCNNLANTLFAIQYEHFDDVNCCSLLRPCQVKRVLALYNEAMEHSQQDFDGAERNSTVDCAIQLADRLFNRGLYFLFIDGYECAPEDSRERGYKDITRSRNLHYDILDSLLEKKQLFANASSYFSRLLRRINCLAAFYDDVGLREIWDARALLDEAQQLASVAAKVSSRVKTCPFFREVNRTGRQQQLEGLEILLAMNSGDPTRAARIGMRMLIEDVYLLESAFVRAAESLLVFMKEGDEDQNISFSKWSIERTRLDLRTMVKSCKRESLGVGKNGVFVFELCPSQWKTSTTGRTERDRLILDELKTQCLQLYDNSFQADDQIGILANNIHDARSLVEIGSKENNEGRQRTFLDDATSFNDSGGARARTTMIITPTRTSGDDGYDAGATPVAVAVNHPNSARPRFPLAIQMLIESSVSFQNDSYIVWVTDGCTYHNEQAMASLRDQIVRVNQERSYQIHVLIIALLDCCSRADENGVALDDQDHHQDENDHHLHEGVQKTNTKTPARQQLHILEEIGNVSKHSIYLEINTKEELASAFQCVSRILPSSRTTSEFISFLTMEKF